jgi:hypothetical protein
LIFGLFFLFTPPVSGLVLPRDSTMAGTTGIQSETPVVFVILDEFPLISLLDDEGQIDSLRYPNFADLSSRSTWYKYTAAAHDNTLMAVPALLSGRQPDNSLLPTTDNYPGNLFTLLSRSHDLNVIEPFTFLCPATECGAAQRGPFLATMGSLIADSAKLYGMVLMPDPSLSVSVSDPFNEFLGGAMDRVNDEAVVDQDLRFKDFLDGIEASPDGLHFVHLFLPHSPFHYYPSGANYNNGLELDGLQDEDWIEPVLANQAYQRHLLQVETVDRLLGDLMSTLDQAGSLEESLIVVTADHGASFELGSARRTVSSENAIEVGLVPLLIKAPDQDQGEVVTTPARTIDVLPTVAEHLGVTLPWQHEGESLLDESRGAPVLMVGSRFGDGVELGDVENGVIAAIADARSRFEDEDGTYDLFAFGPYASMVGLRSDDLVVAPSDTKAVVDETSRLARVSVDSGLLPGFIHGVLEGGVTDDVHVAVALNGEITTVVPVLAVEGHEARFTAVLPEEAFVPGFNGLDLFTVSGSPRSPAVRSVELRGGGFLEMTRSADGSVEALVDSEGTRWTLQPAADIVGYVDAAHWVAASFEGNSPPDLQLQGWAVDEKAATPVEQLVFFVDGEFAGAMVPGVERPGIVDIYENDDVLLSGFLGRISQLAPGELDLRVFALSDGHAAELEILDSAKSAMMQSE